MNNKLKISLVLLTLFFSFFLSGFDRQTTSAQVELNILQDDIFFHPGPGDEEIVSVIAEKFPEWSLFSQNLEWRKEPANIGQIIGDASFAEDFQINSSVTLVTVGIQLNWKIPDDGDLFSVARSTARKLDLLFWEFAFNQNEIQKQFPQINNPATYAISAFFDHDQQNINNWHKSYLDLFGIDPSQNLLRISSSQSIGVVPFLQRPYEDPEDNFYAVNSFFDHRYPRYSAEPSADQDNMYRFDGMQFETADVAGVSWYSGHDAIDYATPRGVHIFAGAAGEVIDIQPELNAVVIEHTNGLASVYMHLDSVDVVEGDTVTRGQKIGEAGDTGDPGEVHLHFGVRYPDDSKKDIDPFGWWDPDDSDPWAQMDSGVESDWLWWGDEANDGHLSVDNRESQAQLFRHTYANFDWNHVDRGYEGEAWYAHLNSPYNRFFWAIWGTYISTPGNYEVQAYWPDDPPNDDGEPTTAAEYKILRKINGELLEEEVTANQAIQSNTWVTLGEYYFDRGTTVVTLSDMTSDPVEVGKRVYFDAIRWVYIPPPTPTPPTPPPGTTITVQVDYSNDDAGVEPSQCVFLTTKQEVYIGKCDNGSLITSGFRFRDVPIPPGAEIQEAYLEFTVDGRYDLPVEVRITGEDIGDAPVFSEFNKPSDRIHTLASTAWDIPPSEVWEVGNVHRTPEMKAIVQEIVDRPDWASGNNMAYIFRTTSSSPGHRRVVGYERPISENHNYPGTEHAARLVVTYTEGTPPTPTPPTPTPPTPTPPTPTPPTPTPPTPTPPTPTPPTPSPGPICSITGKSSLNSSGSVKTDEVPLDNGTPTINTLSVSELLAQAVDLVEFAPLLYDLRDEFLSQTEQGQHYIALYEEHTTEIALILFQNQELYLQGYDILKSLEPNLGALLEGKGNTTIITDDQVFEIQAFLDALAAEASPALGETIQTEREHRPLEELIGLSMEQAWNHVNGYNLTWLPPISKTDPYESKLGSMIPVQFKIETLEGEFVEDETVLLQVINEAGEVILGPFSPGTNPTKGIMVKGKKYHLNLETKDLEPGLYTVEVYYNSVEPGEPAILNLMLVGDEAGDP